MQHILLIYDFCVCLQNVSSLLQPYHSRRLPCIAQGVTPQTGCTSAKWLVCKLTQELPQVKSETGLHTGRAGRDRRKSQTPPDGQVVAGATSKRTYLQSLSWVPQDEQISASTHQNLKGLYRDLHWVQSHVQSKQSQHHTAPFSLSPCKRLALWEGSAGCTFQGRG